MCFNTKLYDILKYISRYVLPALGTLYFALASIWGFPYGEQIVGSITAVVAFVNVLLGISSSNYTGDGTLQIDTSGDTKDLYTISINDLSELASKQKITLQVESDISEKK